MTDRENFLQAVRFGAPQRVPPAIPARALGYLGVNHQGYDDDMDDAHDRPLGSVWTDIWGTVWRKEYPGVMGFPIAYPLDNPDKLASYRWPDPGDERLFQHIFIKADAAGRDADTLLAASHRDTLWEKAYMLVGMENIMAYFYTEPAFVKDVLRHIMDFQMGMAEHYMRAGVELAMLGDDLGTQRSLLLSPAIISEFLVPEYRRLFDFYKRHGVLIRFHSCGHIEPLLDMFMDLGVDILNPIQVTANALDSIIAKTRGRMALEGGISTKLLLEGSRDAIRDAVRETMALLGAVGGYICCPDQGMPFPKESLEALAEAIAEYGQYPLKL